jgi:signal transduction histidine kinase
MMRTFLILLFILLASLLRAQQNIDSLRAHLAAASDGMKRYHAYDDLYSFYEETNKDSAMYYAEQELSLSQRNNKKLTEVFSLNHKAYQLIAFGRYTEALQCLQQAFDIAENKKNDEENPWIYGLQQGPKLRKTAATNSTPDDTSLSGNNRLLVLAYTHHVFGHLMWQTGNTEQEIVHFKEAREIAKEIGDTLRQQLAAMNLGRSYTTINKMDSALIFETEAEQLVAKTGYKKYLGLIYSYMGSIYNRKGDNVKAKEYYYRGIEASTEQKNMVALNRNYFMLTRSCIAEGKKDSAIFYALKALKTFQSLGVIYGGTTATLGTIYKNIYLSYQLNGQVDSAYEYQGLALHAIDSLSQNRMKNLTDFQNAGFNEQLRLQNVEKEKMAYQNEVKTYFFLGGIAVLALLVVIFYRNNRQKNKAKQKIEKAYHELKATQQQLIQSEKMASLGELTAGIAHEIQNPLNFVNNFSEVNQELISELVDEVDKGNLDEVKAIASDIKENGEKINHHGKRADAIVKGMLQHSRASTGKKEPTNINALCDEYLRLSYHGMRAKDKSFNAEFKTDFDENIGKINVVPQDIGRVLLNLYNNAFYALNERTKLRAASYEPQVIVQTKKVNDKVQIIVKDNGNGISQNIVDKIFQPFFTTKPTGQGTGLGLSLAYDIIKAHSGEIKAETEESVGSTFIIQLPI